MRMDLYFKGEVTVRTDPQGSFWAQFTYPLTQAQVETHGVSFTEAFRRLAQEMESEGFVPCYPRT